MCRRRLLFEALFGVALILVAARLLTGCAPAREAAIETSLGALNAARDGFVVMDADFQRRIVEEADSEAAARVALVAYRAKRQELVQAFELGYTAVALAAVTVGPERERNLVAAAGHVLRIYQLIRKLVEGG